MAQYPVAQVVGGQQGGVVGVVSQPSDVNLDIGGRVERMQNELDVPEQIVRDLLSVAGADIVVVADDIDNCTAHLKRGFRHRQARVCRCFDDGANATGE